MFIRNDINMRKEKTIERNNPARFQRMFSNGTSEILIPFKTYAMIRKRHAYLRHAPYGLSTCYPHAQGAQLHGAGYFLEN
jgi:hypothetical protein